VHYKQRSELLNGFKGSSSSDHTDVEYVVVNIGVRGDIDSGSIAAGIRYNYFDGLAMPECACILSLTDGAYLYWKWALIREILSGGNAESQATNAVLERLGDQKKRFS